MLRYLAAAAPALIVLGLVGVLFRAGPKDFLPWWSDEVIYWNEIVNAGRSGVNPGFVAVQEQPPGNVSLRFGPHGPVYPLFYGAIARLAGWKPYSAFVVNLALITAAGIALVAAGGCRMPAGIIPAELVVLALFWPMLLFLPTNMQEPLHFAIALLLAALIARICERRAGRGTWVAAAAIILVGALARPTWALLILPVGWGASRTTRWRATLVAATVAAAAAAQAALTYLSAPFPNAQRELIALAGSDITHAAAMLAARTWNNLRMTISPLNGELPEVALRYLVLAVAAVLLLTLVRRRGAPHDSDAGVVEAASLALLLPLPIVWTLGWVESWRDFRMLAPHLLLALLLAVPRLPLLRRLWWASLAVVPFVIPTFIGFHRDRFTTGDRYVNEMRGLIAPVLAPGAGGFQANRHGSPGGEPWGHTLLVSAESLQHELIAVPPGISLSFVLEWEEMPAHLKSRYLLMRQADEALYRGTLHVERLADTPLGTLYLNLDSAAAP